MRVDAVLIGEFAYLQMLNPTAVNDMPSWLLLTSWLSLLANAQPFYNAAAAAVGDDTTHVRLVRPALTARARSDGSGYASGGALIEVDPRGLALLRSPALANRAVRTVAVRIGVGFVYVAYNTELAFQPL